jgi:hypothetical protein
MNYLVCVLLILAAFILSACNSQSSPDLSEPVSSDEIAALLALTESYDSEWSTMRWEQVAPYHSSDIRYFWRGRLAASSQSEFESLFRGIMTEVKSYNADLVEPHVKILSLNAGVVSFEFIGEVVTPEGATQNYSGAMTYVWQRQDNEWKIVQIHESAPILAE